MVGEKLKSLREAKSWSQAHLAVAAGLNIRTVQRIEAGEPPSRETLLSLAAALNIAVAELEPKLHRHDEDRRLPTPRTFLALVLVAPAALFIAVNLLHSELGISAPFNSLAEVGGKVMTFRMFNLVSPVVFVGGPAIAFAVCLPVLVRFRTARSARNVLNISGVELRADPRALVLAAIALLCAATLIGYAALEFLHGHAS